MLEDLTGRHTVSKQYIADLTHTRGIRQAERDIITAVLEKLPEEQVSVQKFADKMKVAIVPITSVALGEGVRPTGGVPYEYITLPEELRGDVARYLVRIYESPIETSAGDVHFSELSIPDYFAHTRIEDIADNQTRRVIEVQSDLFQKEGLENEMWDVGRQERILRMYHDSPFPPNERALAEEQRKLAQARSGERAAEIARLEPYRDTWYERIVGEEIKRAAQDGKTLLQFPTGETAMKIEGLGQDAGGGMMFAYKGIPVEPQYLKVGREIYSEANDQDWIITDVLGDGKFKAVPKMIPSRFSGGPDYPVLKLINNNDPIVENFKETFDISGKVDISNPIYRFYEHRIQRCLKRIKPDLQRVTDARGVTWFQIQLTPADAEKPVPAFGVARSLHNGS